MKDGRVEICKTVAIKICNNFILFDETEDAAAAIAAMSKGRLYDTYTYEFEFEEKEIGQFSCELSVGIIYEETIEDEESNDD